MVSLTVGKQSFHRIGAPLDLVEASASVCQSSPILDYRKDNSAPYPELYQSCTTCGDS
jgi:hypothetical protein